MVAVDQCLAMAVAVLAPGSRLHLFLTQGCLLSPPPPALLIQASSMQNSCPL
jgi:hypothetical protein